jgi:hypothetical protein
MKQADSVVINTDKFIANNLIYAGSLLMNYNLIIHFVVFWYH